MSTVDDIKSKIDLADYLRDQGLQLKQAGSSLKACCPFHNEKTPSFMVNRQKQVWFCFGCSKGGDLFTFVQEREGLEFGETLKLLADRAGVKLEARDPRLEGQKTRGLAILELAAKFFQQQLGRSEVARQYVTTRKVPDAMVERFQLGYAPDAWDTLSTFLVQRGFTSQEAVAAGLAIASRRDATPSNSHSGRGGGNDRVYDRFRHRLMFPIHDTMGRVVGFTGRILDGGKTTGPAGETAAKYVNTPETALYKKGSIVYGLWHAKDALRTGGHALLVEGQMDVLACHGANLAQAVATSGTALTPEQLRLLKRYTSTLRVAFDADPAGEGAAERGIDAALDAGFDVRVIRMPVGPDGKSIAKDADECIQRDVDAWRSAVENPVPVLDYYTERVQQRFDLRTPAGKRDAGRVLVAHVSHIVDPIERAAWVRRIAEAIGVPESSIREAIDQSRIHQAPGVSPSPAVKPASDPRDRLANRLLALCIRFPELAASTLPMLSEEIFPTEMQQRLYKHLLVGYTTNQDKASEQSYVERLELYADREFTDLPPDTLSQEIGRCSHALRRAHITTELQHIANQLKAIERTTSGTQSPHADVSVLERKFHALTEELATLN